MQFNFFLIWLRWVLVAAGRLLSCSMWASLVVAGKPLVVACMWDLVL